MVKKTLLFSFVLSLFLVTGALAAFTGPPGNLPGGTSGGSTIVPGVSGNITLGSGATSSVTMFQVIPSGANTYSLKVLDTAGANTAFSVQPNGVISIASSTSFSGPVIVSGTVKSPPLASSNLCLTTDGSGNVATTTCGGGGATSTPASYVTPGAFGAGNYSFPAGLSVATTTAPSSGVLFVNGNVGIAKSNPSTALDVNGTVTATQFVGGGVGVTGVTAGAVPWSGVSGTPTTVAGYGISDIYAWAQASTKPSYNFSELTGTLAGSQLASNINIYTTGNVTASQFVGGGAGLTGLTASSIPWTSITGRPTNISSFTNDSGYLTTNQPVTLSGAVTGTGTTTIPTAIGVSPFYKVTAGNDYGPCFWNDCSHYKIMMGNSAEYDYGPVTDYSMKETMYLNNTTRGFTWGSATTTPVAALNSSGVMQIGGVFTGASNFYTTGNANFAGRVANDYYNLGAGSIGAYTVYGYGAMCTENSSAYCTANYGTIIGAQNLNGANNIPNANTIYFGYSGGGYVAIGKKTAATAVDVQGTVTATQFTGPGTGITGIRRAKATGWGAATNWQASQWENLTWDTTAGSTVIPAADMVAGRIMRIRAYGRLYSYYGYTGQSVYMRFDFAGAQLMLLQVAVPNTSTEVWDYMQEITLVWTSGTTFSATMQGIVTLENGGSGAAIASNNANYTVTHADSQPYFWTYWNSYWRYAGIAYTFEYLN